MVVLGKGAVSYERGTPVPTMRAPPEREWLVGASMTTSPLGPVDPSFRALSGRLRFTARRHKFNNDSLTTPHAEGWPVLMLTHDCITQLQAPEYSRTADARTRHI